MSDEIDDVEATVVTIFGQTYHLRAGDDTAYVTELASLVDHKMREVAESSGTADTLKVAVLAALNIADDSLRARRGRAVPKDPRADQRLTRVITLLDEALAG